MKLIINKDRSVIPIGTWGTKNENDFEIVDFEFPEELEGYNKRIVYLLGGGDNPWGVIDRDNKAYITSEITSKENVKGYVWCTKGNPDRPADTDFRSQEFDIPFYENEPATGVVPTPQQVDGFNTMLTEMNAKIDEVDALETTIETAEAQRQEAEISREERTDEAINNIIDMTSAYNQNAQEKTDAFNSNATQKTNDFDSHVTQKVNDFDTHATQKTSDFDTHVADVTDGFNENAAEKTETLNQIAEGIEDMTTAIQFASFEVDNDMHLNIIQAERMPNTNFLFNPDTGRLGVRIYNG
jgi:hypothetical protein